MVIHKIREAISVGDKELAIRLVHTIKGVSGELSAEKVYAIATQLEADMINGNFDISSLLDQLDRNLNKIFSSPIFIQDEEIDENENKPKIISKLNFEEIKPLLIKLENSLSEYDLDSIGYIEKLYGLSKNTSIESEVEEMKEYGEGYDFEGAIRVFNEIDLIINKID